MNIELYVQNSNTGKVYDISNIAEEIKVTSSIEGDAGKLTCILQKDPNNIAQIANGSIVSFVVDKTGIFFGYIFKIGTDADENYEITCYDQMRYLKNNEVYVTKNMTASQIFAKVCQDYGLRYRVKVPSYYTPAAYVHDKKTLYQVIERGMHLADIYENAQYFIKDNFGTIEWSELSYEKTNIQLGGGSLLTSYKYEKSIDDDTYNQIKLYKEDKKKGKRDVWIVRDSNNIKKWGMLQFLEKADDNDNNAQIAQKAQNYLKAKNRETEKLSLTAEGINELVAGRGIKFVLPRENIDKWLWITSATHTYTKYEHTMDLEVAI